MTKRQREARDWLRTVGKATPKVIRRNGFQVRTFDALADNGYVERAYVDRTIGGPFPVYRVSH